jgi:hypothetical protein
MTKSTKRWMRSSVVLACAALLGSGAAPKVADAMVDPDIRCDFSVPEVCATVTWDVCIEVLGELECTTHNDTIVGLRLET